MLVPPSQERNGYVTTNFTYFLNVHISVVPSVSLVLLIICTILGIHITMRMRLCSGLCLICGCCCRQYLKRPPDLATNPVQSGFDQYWLSILSTQPERNHALTPPTRPVYPEQHGPVYKNQHFLPDHGKPSPSRSRADCDSVCNS